MEQKSSKHKIHARFIFPNVPSIHNLMITLGKVFEIDFVHERQCDGVDLLHTLHPYCQLAFQVSDAQGTGVQPVDLRERNVAMVS